MDEDSFNLKRSRFHVQSADLAEDEAIRMQDWHEETRFRRHAHRRRARIVERFLKDPDTVRSAAELYGPAFGERLFPLPESQEVIGDFAGILARRFSVSRHLLTEPLTWLQLGQILDLGVRSNRAVNSPVVDVRFDLRPYPSAGALYPCEIYVVMGQGDCAGLPLRYDARRHVLVDYGAVGGEYPLVEIGPPKKSPACAVVIAGILSRSTTKYGPRGYRFAVLEAGHIGQNLSLVATSLGLPSLVSGSYFDGDLERWLGLDGRDQVVLSTVLIGGHDPSSAG